MGGRGNFKGDPKSIEPFLTIGKSMFFGKRKKILKAVGNMFALQMFESCLFQF